MKKTALITISELEQKAKEIGVPQSGGTDTSHALFIPQYIPLYRTQRKTGKTLFKKIGITSFLYTIRSIAAVQCFSNGASALAISAVPLYTGEQ